MAKIRAIRDAPEQFDLKRELSSFLQNRSNHVIAAAAKAIEQNEASALAPDLIQAFLALLPDAPARDQGCKALTAIVEALVTLGEDADGVYLKGVSYIQMEGSFGPPIDTAAPLRGLCARGLVRMRHSQAMYEAVTLLADRQIPARVGAVAALGDAGSREAELLLRLKILDGDDAEVLGACFAALLSVAPRNSIPFVTGFLNHRQIETVEAAAIALGETRDADAFTPLRNAWTSSPKARRTILLALAMLRQDEGLQFLLTRLKQDPEAAALDALEAIALYRGDGAVRAQVREIAAVRPHPKLKFAVEREWRD